MSRDSKDSGPPSPALLRFLERRFEDEAEGHAYDLAHYLSLFPEIADDIRREWEKLDHSSSETSRAQDAAPRTGEKIGPYVIERRIGRGGFGVVYLATDTRVGRSVAIKFLSATGDFGDESLKRFRREAEAIAQLDHPAIGALYDAHLDPPAPYLVMRYVEGKTLSAALGDARMTGTAPLALRAGDVDLATRYRDLGHFFEIAARALAAAHAHGVVHRDLKPANIMVTPDATPVVLDFGLARRTDDETLTRTEEIIGTLSYMAPETIAGKAIDPRADVYSLGATLYECVTLKKPFAAPTSQALMRMIADTDPPAPSERAPELPRDLESIILAAMEKDPARRYADARALADDLAAFIRGDEISAKRPSTIARMMRSAQRRPARAALIVVVSLAVPIVLGLGYALMRQRPAVQAEAARVERSILDRKIEDGFFLLGQWQSADGEKLFDEVLSSAPDDVEAIGGKVLAQIIQKKADRALTFLDERRAIVENSPALALLRANARVEAGKVIGTEVAPSAPAAGDQGASIYSYFLGWTALRRGEAGDAKGYPDALRAFSDAVATSRSARAIFHFELARAAGLASDKEAALRASAAIRTLWPKSVNGAFYAAFGLTGAGQFKEAIEEYRRALALEPHHRMSELGLGSALMGAEMFDDAITLYTDVLARDAKDWTAHQNIAIAYANKGDFDRALAHDEIAVTLDPENPELHGALVDLYDRRGDAKKLEAELRRWVGLQPKDPVALVNLAMQLASGDAKEEARATAQKALDLIAVGRAAPPEVKAAAERLARE